MSCSAIAAECSGLSRTASNPPCTFGWRVFTRPSIISGKPVRSETSRTVPPLSRSFAAVPPVETSSTPRSTSAFTSVSRPALSETESSARRTGTRSVIVAPFSARAAELPLHFGAFGPGIATHHQLHGPIGLAAGIHDQAFFDPDRTAARAEVPRRRARRAQYRAHSVCGDGRLDPGSEMEADREGNGFALLLHRFKTIGAANLLAVIAEGEGSPVQQAEPARVAVMARLDPARVIVLGSIHHHIAHPLAERSVGQNGGGIGVRQRERAVRGGRPKRIRKLVRELRRQRLRSAAIHDEPLRTVGKLEGEGRGAARWRHLGRRRRGRIDDDDRSESGQAMVAPALGLPERAGAQAAALNDRG